jgi:hypothetical protein
LTWVKRNAKTNVTLICKWITTACQHVSLEMNVKSFKQARSQGGAGGCNVSTTNMQNIKVQRADQPATKCDTVLDPCVVSVAKH